MDYLLYFRELFVKNYCVSIAAIEINNIRFKHSIFFHLFKILPFSIIKFFFDLLNKIISFKYIYKMDNLYFSNYLKEITISPIILNLELFDNNENKISIKENIQKYNRSIPIWYFLYNENIQYFLNYKIKYILKGQFIEKEEKLNENKLLKDLSY
jgi:hypothetical protein